jgi:cell division protein FtsZ
MEFIVQEAIEKSNRASPAVEIGQANMKVIGLGGGGCNAVSWLHKKGIQGAEVVAMNTDKQHLDITSADRKILLGKELTRGLGAGGYPKKGEEAARESMNEIKEVIRDADMVFVTAGLGGGTGTGTIPVVAKVAKDEGSIVIAVVTMPFDIERARIDKAEFGLQMLRDECDTAIVIDNNRLVQIAGQLPIEQAFAVANELISTMMKAIVETIAVPSLVNLDYADVKAIMGRGEVSSIGIGESQSENRVEEAVKRALSNPLLDVSYQGATGALIQVDGGKDLLLDEVSKVGELITETLDSDANVIWGARILDDMKGKLRVMTIVTGVKSPYILGKVDRSQPSRETRQMSEDLGIDLIN